MTLLLEAQNLILDPSGAVYWTEKEALFIADAHLGKVNHFRKNGIAVPPLSQYNFYKKMAQLLQRYKVKTIYFLGDLFHSEKNNAWNDFEAWVKEQTSDLVLISGNHDIIPRFYFTKIGVRVEASLVVEPFYLSHFPSTSSHFNFCGHLHPGVRLHGKGLQRLKVPCFFHKPKQMILPAFGVFTGVHLLRPSARDKVYALSAQNVIPIPLK